MTSAYRRFAFAYGAAFAIFYVVVLFEDLALFTVYPSLGIVVLGTHRSRDVADPALGFLAPEMFWYGWTATAAIAAFFVGLVAALLPDHWTRRWMPGALWVMPVVAMVACVYHTVPWFRR
jgi:MFS family permease